MPARNGCAPLPEAYFGDVPGVGMNHAIYSRTGIEKARTYHTKREALAALRNLGDWPARCEPPITVVY